MAIATFAEINFSVLTPFILSEMHYTNGQIASMMSTLAVSDIVARFGSPFVGDALRWSPRVMYMAALTLLIVTRMSGFRNRFKCNSQINNLNPVRGR